MHQLLHGNNLKIYAIYNIYIRTQPIYYILYDNNPTSNFAESIIKNYGLPKDNIIIDKNLLNNVYEEYEIDYHYRLIEYGNSIKVEKYTFEEFVPIFEKKVEERLKQLK